MLFSTADRENKWGLQRVTATILAKLLLRAPARGTVAVESSTSAQAHRHGTHLECTTGAKVQTDCTELSANSQMA